MAAPLRLRLFVGGTVLSVAAIAAIAGWLVVRGLRVEAPTVEFVDVEADRAELLTERLEEGAEIVLDDLDALGRELYRGLIEEVDEDLARKYFAVLKQGRAEYVPGVLFRALPGADSRRPFEEHPAGRFRRRTNSVGMHEDQDPRDPAPDLRILVMGDSHVAGVCSNRESFPTHLETGLSALDPERTVEVLNLAQGSYDALNYLGTFRTWGDLKPDVLVLVIYGGNDFRGSLGLGRYLLRRGPPTRLPYQLSVLQKDRPYGPGLLGQAVGQAAFFLANPDEVDLARDLVAAVVLELAEQARAQNTRLLVALLPSPAAGQPEIYLERLVAAMEQVGADPAGLGVDDRLADGLLEILRSRGVAHLDLRPTFRSAGEALYWNTDLHLNLAGHELVAREVELALGPLLE